MHVQTPLLYISNILYSENKSNTINQKWLCFFSFLQLCIYSGTPFFQPPYNYDHLGIKNTSPEYQKYIFCV